MQKIPSLFKRDYEETRLVYDEVVPGCEWVLAGEGVATVKFDGTACKIKDSRLYKRYEVKKRRQPPSGFIAADVVDETTGKQPGWVPVGDGPEDKYHREGWDSAMVWIDGTYELVGPKVQGNPEGMAWHSLILHGSLRLDVEYPKADPRTFVDIQQFLTTHDIEGIVWWHKDGRKAKIKKRDFGIQR